MDTLPESKRIGRLYGGKPGRIHDCQIKVLLQPNGLGLLQPDVVLLRDFVNCTKACTVLMLLNTSSTKSAVAEYIDKMVVSCLVLFASVNPRTTNMGGMIERAIGDNFQLVIIAMVIAPIIIAIDWTRSPSFSAIPECIRFAFVVTRTAILPVPV